MVYWKGTMEQEINEILINGKTYILKDGINQKSETFEGLEYKIVRTYTAGVFAGYLKERNGKEVTLIKARRIWYWTGAASLSQLAQQGTSTPETCKFPEAVDRVVLTEAIEILDVTKKAKQSIEAVKIWNQ